MREVAVCKLEAFDLDSNLDLEVGAYGFDAAERPPLVALARERAAHKYAQTFGPETTVLIGDTPAVLRAVLNVTR